MTNSEQPPSTKSAKSIEPGNWPTEKDKLLKNPNGLRKVIGLYGSTHARAEWRTEDAFKQGLGENVPNSFNPRVEGWDPSYAEREAEVMAEAAVLVFRLENKGLKDGSLGSLAEIGFAAASAVLRGQKVIVSIEENFQQSLAENPSSQTQWAAFEVLLTKLAKVKPDVLRLHQGDDLAELGQRATDTLREQMEQPVQKVDYQAVLGRKKQRQTTTRPHLVMTGSGAAHSKHLSAQFNAERKVIFDSIEDNVVTKRDLTSGAMKEAWDSIYFTDNMAAKSALLLAELDEKMSADVLVVPIHDEAMTKAGTTEMGWFILNAILTGQQIAFMMEPVDPDGYIKAKLASAITSLSGDFRQQLVESKVFTAEVAQSLTDLELQEVRTFWEEMMKAPSKDGLFKTAKGIQALKRSQLWIDADNMVRVRHLAEAHLTKLHQDYPELFILAKKPAELAEKLEQVSLEFKVAREAGSTPQPEQKPASMTSPFARFFDPATQTEEDPPVKVENEAAKLARELVAKVESQEPEITGTKEEILSKIKEYLGLSDDQIKVTESTYQSGPNMMPRYSSRLIISIAVRDRSPIEVLKLDSLNSSNSDYERVAYRYYLDFGRLKSALDRVLHPQKYQSTSSGLSSSELWWKD